MQIILKNITILTILFSVALSMGNCSTNTKNKNKVQSNIELDSTILDSNKLLNSIEKDNIEHSKEEKKGIRLIFGDKYNYGSKDYYSVSATNIYIQVGRGKEIKLPFAITNEISLSIPNDMKANFNPEINDYKIEFELYHTYINEKIAFIGIKTENNLLIYRKIIGYGEDIANKHIFFELVSEFEINNTDLKLIYSRDNTFYTNDFEQDAFESISYSNDEIAIFIKDKFQDNSNIIDINFFTKRFLDFLDYASDYCSGGLSLGQENRFENMYKNTYNIKDLGNYACAFNCPNIDYNTELPTIVEIRDIKREDKFYNAKLYISVFDAYNNGLSCQEEIRLVQINGLLYFDSMIEI